jgi:hypothetical protein
VTYDAPLGTRVSKGVKERLGLARWLTGKSISRLVDDALDQALPPMPAELSREIDPEGNTDDHAA